MNTNDSQIYETYLPVYDAVPKSWEEARPFIVEQLKRVAQAINTREIGWFLDEELISGKQFIPSASASASTSSDSQQYRTILRKVIDFGTLPNTTSKSVPHGITVDSNFTLMQIYGAATDPTGLLSIPLPFVSAASPAKPIQLFMNATDVVVISTENNSNYTRSYIVVEYIQEL